MPLHEWYTVHSAYPHFGQNLRVCLNAKVMCTELCYCNCEDCPNIELSLAAVIVGNYCSEMGRGLHAFQKRFWDFDATLLVFLLLAGSRVLYTGEQLMPSSWRVTTTDLVIFCCLTCWLHVRSWSYLIWSFLQHFCAPHLCCCQRLFSFNETVLNMRGWCRMFSTSWMHPCPGIKSSWLSYRRHLRYFVDHLTTYGHWSHIPSPLLLHTTFFISLTSSQNIPKLILDFR